MSEETIFERTDRRDRHETATFLRQLADAFDDGAPLWFAGDDAPETPDELDLEVELDRETDDELSAYELEVEAEWDDRETADETAIGADAEPSETATSTADEADTQTADGDGETTADTESGDAIPPVDPADEAERDETADASLARFELFRDRADEWRWRLVHRNGNIIADSGEGYTRRANAEKGLRSVMRNAPGAAVVREDGD